MPSSDIDFAFDEARNYERPEDMPMEPDPEPEAVQLAPVPVRTLGTGGRTLPSSLEAEEYLLSCCFLDGADVMERCEAANISPATFYFPSLGMLYGVLWDTWKKGLPVDIAVVAEELKARKLLEQVGGIAFLSQVTGLVSTTAQTSYFIQKVRELALLRDLIKSATGAVEECYNYSGDIAGFAAEIEAKITSVTKRAQGATTWTTKPLTEFAMPPAEDPSILLGKYRYLCRGGALVLVGSSGTGKSSGAVQMAVHWALGRDFLGITCAKPLRSIVVQAEDDEGDVAEVWASISAALQLTADEIALVKSRVLIVEDRITSGAEFLSELKSGAARWKPDLVFLNPLLSFAGCAIADQEQMTAFLRNGLNRVNADKKWAYIVVHHTNKPPSQKDGAARNWNEYMYNMAGSAELPNWARAVITIEAKKEEGQFVFRLAKRGKRAGVVKEIAADPEEGEGAHRVEVVTKINAQHSSRKIQLPDGRSLPMMVWEPGKDDGETGEQAPPSRRQFEAPTGRKPKHAFEDFRGLWPIGEANAMPYGQLKRHLGSKVSLSDGALGRLLKQATDDGKLAFHTAEDKRKSGYYVPL